MKLTSANNIVLTPEDAIRLVAVHEELARRYPDGAPVPLGRLAELAASKRFIALVNAANGLL